MPRLNILDIIRFIDALRAASGLAPIIFPAHLKRVSFHARPFSTSVDVA